jgi:hypothetical protein
MNMIRTFLVSIALTGTAALLLATPTAQADTAPAKPPGPPPTTTKPPAQPPVQPEAPTGKIWSKINVESIKPTLTARNVFVIRGMHNNGVRGGWTVESSYVMNKDTSVIQISLAASAPAGSVATKNLEKVEAKVEINELAGNAVGKFDVVVVDHDGKELARTVYDRK